MSMYRISAVLVNGKMTNRIWQVSKNRKEV